MPKKVLRSPSFLLLSGLFGAIGLTALLSGCSLPRLLFKSADPEKSMGAILRHDPKSGKITQAGLQAEVMDVSDQYVLLLWQGLDEIIRGGVSPEQRIRINRAKVVYSSAALTIAAGRNPAANLLDMVVFITVNRMVVEDYWAPQVFGPKAKGLLQSLRKLEKETWLMAAQVLSSDQQENLRNLIQQWRVAHPKQYYVSYVRFADFASLQGKSPLQREGVTHGLLAEVEKALAKVDEAFLLGERAMFYVERAPRIMTMQSELMVDEVATNPQVQRLLGESEKATGSFAALVKNVEKWPSQVGVERQAAIKQLTAWAASERQQLWQDLAREEPRLKGMLTEFRQVLLESNELARTLGTMMKPLQSDPKTPPGEPVDYVAALKQTSDTIKQATILVKSMDDFIVGGDAANADLVKVLRQVNLETKSLLDRAFWLALILIAVFLAGLAAVLAGVRLSSRRRPGSGRAITELDS